MKEAWKLARERRLLRDEIDRQERNVGHPFNPDSGCACWVCLGKLMAWVVMSRVEHRQ